MLASAITLRGKLVGRGRVGAERPGAAHGRPSTNVSASRSSLPFARAPRVSPPVACALTEWLMRESPRPILPRLGDCLLERPPCAGAVLDLVLPRKALAGPRHQALVALPFVQEHRNPSRRSWSSAIPQRRTAARSSPCCSRAHAIPATQ